LIREQPKPAFSEVANDGRVWLAVAEEARLLLARKDAAILDIGFRAVLVHRGLFETWVYKHLRH
jgi:hypothetical protein